MMRVERYVTADAVDRVLRPGDILRMTGFLSRKISRVGVCISSGKIAMGLGYGVISIDDLLAGSRHRWRRYHIYNLERDVNFDDVDLEKLADAGSRHRWRRYHVYNLDRDINFDDAELEKLAHELIKERFTDAQIISRIWHALGVTDDTYQTASDVIGSHVLRRNFFTIKKA
jgi:hypothetical protein